MWVFRGFSRLRRVPQTFSSGKRIQDKSAPSMVTELPLLGTGSKGHMSIIMCSFVPKAFQMDSLSTSLVVSF